LNILITQALNSTTAQINLLNINGKPTETDVPITIYNAHSGKIEYSFVHTLNHRGNPDTLRLDPIPMYKIVVHTIPSVAKDSIKIIPGIHNIIAVDAPQGLLNIKSAGGSDKQPLQAIIRKKGDLNTLIVQSLPSTEKYLVGKYDIEILTLPRTYLYDIDIKQSHTTSIEIPQSGILTISKNSPGYGSILLEEKNELKLVTNLSENSLRETYQLQPGNYRVVYRPKSAKESVYTIEEKFKIQSGGSASIKL
jgi:Ca-activated chloride channel homolog